MKNQKRGWSIPRPVAIRGAWLCVGSLIALFVLMVTDTQQDVRPAQVVVMLAALFGVALFIGNWVNTTQQGIIYGHKQLLNLRSPMWPTYHFYGGTPRQYLDFFRHDTGPETIALVAWTHKNGNIYAVERPGRHGHVIAMLAEMGLAGAENLLDDGFVTSHGRYVNRKEAVIIATSQGQTVRKTSPVNKLFSEDLWYTPKEMRNPAYAEELLDKDKLRVAILSTLPSLAYLHDESIQISEAELAAEKLARMEAAKHAPREDDPSSFVGIIAQTVGEVIPDSVVAQEEPIPATGVLTKPQLARLVRDAWRDFYKELDAELAQVDNLVPDDLKKTLVFRQDNETLDYEKVAKHTHLAHIVYMIEDLANFASRLRQAKLGRMVETSDVNLMHKSNQARRLASLVAGKQPEAYFDALRERANMLIAAAVDEGVVLTIELEPMDPSQPAMGKYYMVPHLREAYGSYAPRLLVEQELKSKES